MLHVRSRGRRLRMSYSWTFCVALTISQIALGTLTILAEKGEPGEMQAPTQWRRPFGKKNLCKRGETFRHLKERNI